MNHLNFYQETNNLNLNKMLIPLGVGIVGSIILGFLYASLVYFIPFPYLTFFVAIGLAMAIGLSARLLIRIFRITGKKNRILLVCIVVIFTYYFHWVAYLLLFFKEGGITLSGYLAHLSWILLPDFSFFSSINQLASDGAWSMFGILFAGIILVIVWMLELAIIFALAIRTGKNYSLIPFSAKFNSWYPKFTLSEQFEHIASVKYVEKQIQDANIIGFISNLNLGQGFAYTRIHIYFNKKEQHQYLTLEKVNIERRGKGKINVSPILQHLRISTLEAETILQNYIHSIERFDLF
ncbi:MAG: hypothetical protein ACI86M_001873 [Saprospiraceae bacterium]|jgi:hypothetical protein